MDCLNAPQILPQSPRKTRGQIQVIFGPMFSGKRYVHNQSSARGAHTDYSRTLRLAHAPRLKTYCNTELMRRVRRFQIAQYKCLVIKYAKDTRYSEKGMATHDKNTMEAVPANCLSDVHSLAVEACVIGVDEGQFFPDTVEFCEEMANMGKTIIVAALDGTFQRKAFGNILNLVPLAESVVKLNAVCMQCFKEAAYTKRLGAEKEVEVIGGADKYHAVCRACYGGLMSGKENSGAPQRDETPPHAISGKQLDHSTPRKLFATLHL